MIKLSKASKMPCRSWSLQAIDTCPGSVGADGELVPVCKGCYATTGNYRFPNVKKPREHNREDWKRDSWADEMVAELDNDRYFRWFDSGDMYSIGLAHKILEIVSRTPWCNHWLPTRMHKFPKFLDVIEQINALPNAVVRLSGDNIGEAPEGTYVSKVISSADIITTAKVCKAYENDGKCGSCRACWSKDTPVIAYLAHGKQMEKVIAKSSS